MIFIDSNIILRFILSDDIKLSPLASKILQKIENGRTKAYLSAITIAEIIYVLLKVYKFDREEISQKLLPLLQLNNLNVENKSIYDSIFRIFTQQRVDFEDAYLVALMNKKKISRIYSFDRDFDKFPQIKRLEQ